MAKTAIHPFESFGPAPYQIIRVRDNSVQRPYEPVRACGCCDVCMTDIRWEYTIRAANGVEFVTGCDCAEKAGMSAKELRESRRAYVRECWERESRREREERLVAERERNGGLTDKERDAATALGVAFARTWLKKERAYNAVHLGTVGKRLRGLEVIVEHTHSFDTAFGVQTIWIMRDRAGNQIVVKTSSGIGCDVDGQRLGVVDYNQRTGVRSSRWFLLDGTVKEHNEYNGMRQTVLQRAKGTAIKSDWIPRDAVRELTYRRAA